MHRFRPEEDSFRFDLWTESAGVLRGRRVTVGETSLRVGDIEVRYDRILWKARRADLLMLFTSGRTLALQGEADPLNRLDRGLVRRLGSAGSRTSFLESVVGEVLVFAAAVAARGRVDSRPVTGLHVAVVTRDGLHLFSRDARCRLSFPVSAIRTGSGSERGVRDTVVLRRGDDRVELLYLFPEERRALIEVAG